MSRKGAVASIPLPPANEGTALIARFASIALLLSACSLPLVHDYGAMRTRVTADGGEYTVYAHEQTDLAYNVRATLSAIARECNGTYEVVGMELLPISPRDVPSYFVALDGSAADGYFHTGIAYECRPPASEALNERLNALAATAPPDPPVPPPAPPKPPKAPEPCIVTYDCPVGSVCAPTVDACKGR